MIQISKPIIGKEEIDAVISVLESGILTQGKLVGKFEDSLRKYCGYRYAIAVNSGTAALHIGAIALNVNGNFAVPDFTFAATAGSVKLSGNMPIFFDVNEKTFNMDFSRLRQGKFVATIPVSLFGQPYDVDEMTAIRKESGIKVISDNAQSLGTEWRGKKNFGDDIAILSFYPTKNITTTEGGAILTDNKELAETCASLRNHGQKEKYSYERVGFNYRMTEIAAAIGLEQIKKLEGFIEKRIRNAKMLTELLENSVETPFIDQRCRHVFNQYTIKTDKRDAVIKNMTANGIGYGIYYPSPLHSQKAFSSDSECPVTDKLCKKVLSLPVHPSLTEDDIQKIAETVRKSA
ncbi:MAG: DegT/DnrJ/EryC1/StrS aminotransferase family protein [Candidatus Aenigmatarchaeota archaeon]